MVDKSIFLLLIYFISIFLLVNNLMNFSKDFLILVNHFKLSRIIRWFLFILICNVLIIIINLIFLYILWLYFILKFILYIFFELLFLPIENIIIETQTSLLFIVVLMCKRYSSIHKFLIIIFFIITFCLVILNMLWLIL